MENRCAEYNCLNKTDGCKYCPKHKPKPYWRNATKLLEKGRLDVTEGRAKWMEERWAEVFGRD